MVQAQQSAHSASLTTRYKNAFRVAKAINGLGVVIRIFGVLVTATAVVAGVAVSQQMHDQRAIYGGIAAGVFLHFAFHVLSVIVSAQGQMLKALLDSAVNTSPFLGDDQRAQIMSL